MGGNCPGGGGISTSVIFRGIVLGGGRGGGEGFLSYVIIFREIIVLMGELYVQGAYI